jgi:cob(I)alamin adenosyltransferase
MSSKFFTAKGDSGTTGLLGDRRVSKSDPQIEALGAIDETTAALGLARSLTGPEDVRQVVLAVQRRLYLLMGETAATPENAGRFRRLTGDDLSWLEAQVESFGARTRPVEEFILPGDSPVSAAYGLARTAARRAERVMVRLGESRAPENLDLFLAYLNRLSSFCYVLELYTLQTAQNSSPTLAKKE